MKKNQKFSFNRLIFSFSQWLVFFSIILFIIVTFTQFFNVFAETSGRDGTTFEDRKSIWISEVEVKNTSNISGLDFGPQPGRQHVLAWAEQGSHGKGTCRSTATLQSIFDQNTSCIKTAEGTCAGPYIDYKTGVEKFVDLYSGETTWNDLMCIDGNIQGLLAWKDQSGSLVPNVLARLYLQYKYPDSRLGQFFRDIVGDSYFFDSSPSDTQGSRDMQPIQTAVHYLAALQSPNSMVEYGDRGAGFSRVFTYGNTTYSPGNSYNALNLTRDWLYAQMDEILKQPNEETNSRSYQSRAVSAFRLLYDFGEPEMRERAKMSLDALFLDAGMQFSLGVNQLGGILGRSYRSAYEGGGDTMPWYVYWGANNKYSWGSTEGFVSSYKLPTLIEDMPNLSGGQWILKQDSYRNNVFMTDSFTLAVGLDGGGPWRIEAQGTNPNAPFDFWINDLAGDIDGNACEMAGNQSSDGRTISTCGGVGECYTCLGMNGSLFKNNILFQTTSSNPTFHFTSANQSFDEGDENLTKTGIFKNEFFLKKSQWNYLREGNTGFAIWPGPGYGAIEVARIDTGCSNPNNSTTYQDFCYSSFNDFISSNLRSKSVNGASFVNGKGILVDKSKTHTRATGRIVASSSDSPDLVTWNNNNVMTVTRYGQKCMYDFNLWNYSGDCGEFPSGLSGYVPPVYTGGNGGTTGGNTGGGGNPGTVTPPANVKFKIWDMVKTNALNGLNVRSTPSTSGTILSTKPIGTIGTIIDGPFVNDGLTWWQVKF